MSTFLRIDSGWTGGDTRNDAASVFVNAGDGSSFDVEYGVRYYVSPGDGWYDNCEVIKSLTLTASGFKVEWKRTGGQNHVFELKFASGNQASGGSTGPKGYRSSTSDNLQYQIGRGSDGGGRVSQTVQEREFEATAGRDRQG
jgi:hypothetical protein